MTNGLQIVQKVYTRLRRPSDVALPYPTILSSVRDVIAKKKLDLALSEQNTLSSLSEWFTVSESDVELGSISSDLENIFLPIRVDRRGIGSDWQTGNEIPIVNYEVLNNTSNGVAFYGNPMRMVFRAGNDYVAEQEFRISFESDFSDNVGLNNSIQLPDFFTSLVVDETLFEVIDLVEDNSPEWMEFAKTVNSKLPLKIADSRAQWNKYVKRFRGKARVPKRTIWNRGRCVRPVFSGDYE